MTAIPAFRNFACRLLALGLIATGRTRRAAKMAFSGDTITAIYFHNPNKRLFERCIRWLSKHGCTFLTAEDVVECLSGSRPFPKGAVWLSFDDGCKELRQNVIPLARREKIPITLFVPSGILEGDGLFHWLPRDGARHAMTVAELKEAGRIGEVTIGSHTVTHAHLARCNQDELMGETGASKQALEQHIGAAVTHFAYPYGEFSGRERSHLIRFGYKLAATTENAYITPKTDPYLVPRFAVANDISFAEAVCNMTGVWRPFVGKLKALRARAAGNRPGTLPAANEPQIADGGVYER